MTTLEVSSRIAIQNILFATDFAPCSKAAVPYALAIAHQYGAKLYAAHVLSPSSYTFVTAEDWGAMADQKGKQHHMDVVLLEEHLRGIPHQVLSPVGEVVDVIFRLIRDHDIDLLVLGTHGRTGLPKLLMGSVAERVFRQASCPVLTVGPNVPHRQESVAEFNQILFATDFSDESLAALPHAISLAREHQARLSLLHVLERPDAGIRRLAIQRRFPASPLTGTGPGGQRAMVPSRILRGVWFSTEANPAVRRGSYDRLDGTGSSFSCWVDGCCNTFGEQHGPPPGSVRRLPRAYGARLKARRTG